MCTIALREGPEGLLRQKAGAQGSGQRRQPDLGLPRHSEGEHREDLRRRLHRGPWISDRQRRRIWPWRLHGKGAGDANGLRERRERSHSLFGAPGSTGCARPGRQLVAATRLDDLQDGGAAQAEVRCLVRVTLTAASAARVRCRAVFETRSCLVVVRICTCACARCGWEIISLHNPSFKNRGKNVPR